MTMIDTRDVHAKDILTWTAMIIMGTLLAFAIHTNTSAVKQAHTALCNQKQQAQQTVTTTKAFLANPSDPKYAYIARLNIPKPVLLRSIAQNQKTVDSLGGIKCSQ
jgi:hypothetical protein